MKYLTTRICLEAFEFDPHKPFPQWFSAMVRRGKAFVYTRSKYQEAKATFGEYTAYIGDRIYIDETGHVGVFSAGRFSMCCQPLDDSRDASIGFKLKIDNAIDNFMADIEK